MRGLVRVESTRNRPTIQAFLWLLENDTAKGEWVDETAVVAALIRKRTGVRNRWVAERLGMGHEGNVTRAIRRVNEYPAWKSRLADLEAMLVSRD